MTQPDGNGPPRWQEQVTTAPQYSGYRVPPGRGGPLGEWVACPRCRSPYVLKVAFTWWGGVVGPLIVPEVRCATCGHHYNGKTGGSLGAPIAIYTIVVVGFVLVLVAVVALLVIAI